MAVLDTGNEGALTFAGFTGLIISIGATEMTRPVLDTSYLGTTTYRTSKAGDLVDPGEFDIEFFYDSADVPDITEAGVVSITVILPGNTNITGNGFFVSFSTPEVMNDEILKGKGRIHWADAPTVS